MRRKNLAAGGLSRRPGRRARAGRLDRGRIDLVKPLDRLVAAYDDSQGVTDAFIRNAFHVINRELDGNLDVGKFDYVPFWDPREERIDMRLRALEPEHASVGALGLELELEAVEELRIEISAKFRSERFEADLADAGFDDVATFTDAADDFAVVLARRRGEGRPSAT